MQLTLQKKSNKSKTIQTQPFMSLKLTIATRESRLALWQANHVKDLLESLGHQVTLLGMTTMGDQILDKPLSKVGGKGLFIKELETALADGSADLAVHSLKDVPMELPEGFSLACILTREDPRDSWVSNEYPTLQSLPHGAVVGTSSLRRTVLINALRPDLVIEPLRGNLDTRLKKLDDGHYQGIILAAAGLKRLGLSNRIRSTFGPEVMLPAAGQGAIGVEINSKRAEVAKVLKSLNHIETTVAVYAERAVSRTMGGSCSMPLAAHATLNEGVLSIDAAWGDHLKMDSKLINAKDQCHIDLKFSNETEFEQVLEKATSLGNLVAKNLIAQGARPA